MLWRLATFTILSANALCVVRVRAVTLFAYDHVMLPFIALAGHAAMRIRVTAGLLSTHAFVQQVVIRQGAHKQVFRSVVVGILVDVVYALISVQPSPKARFCDLNVRHPTITTSTALQALDFAF
jgi:hypothetical protein